jgi:hypothetical protein
MPITWDDVIELDAKLSDVPEGLQNAILARVEKLSPDFFDGDTWPLYGLARRLLAAHIATPFAYGASGVSGPVTQRTEGGVSESYAVAQASLKGLHSSTSHGRAFDELVASRPGRVGLTT